MDRQLERQSLYFVNHTELCLVLSLEPWGEDFRLRPRQRFETYHRTSWPGHVAVSIQSDSVFVSFEHPADYPERVLVDGEEVGCGPPK